MKLDFELPKSALEKWSPNIKAKADDSDINIYQQIGEDYEGRGVTPKMIAGILRNMGGKDITVNINSPGGSFFDGVAIYNLFREYEGNVKVRVVGLAASAASVIAMAGDEIEIAESGFLMIHNAWTLAIGNKEDMQEVSDMLAKFDASMRDLYSKRTGISGEDIEKMMAEETWLSGSDAIEKGFADGYLPSDSVEKSQVEDRYSALREIDIQLAKAGQPRSKRRKLIKEITGTPSAAEPTPSAGQDDEVIDALSNILTKLKGK